MDRLPPHHPEGRAKLGKKVEGNEEITAIIPEVAKVEF